VTAWSRHGTQLDDRLGDLLAPLSALPAGTVLDGELIALAERDGRPVQDFAAVGHAALRRDRDAARRVQFVAFDLLSLDGQDLRAQTLLERAAALSDAMPVTARLRVTQNQPANQAAHQALVGLGFEGSVLKRPSSPYRPGRQRTWRKHKARHRLSGVLIERKTARDGRPYAVCELNQGGRSWAAITYDAIEVGERVDVVYSRVDADGTLREARVASPARTAPTS
jgi:ATP-dependent DNA ligase